VEGVGKQCTEAIRCGACYYSIMLNAHCVTSMADTDIDAVRKQKKTYTGSGTSVIKDGRYMFNFYNGYWSLYTENYTRHYKNAALGKSCQTRSKAIPFCNLLII
jgi:hypothetical protein